MFLIIWLMNYISFREKMDGSKVMTVGFILSEINCEVKVWKYL